MTELMSKLECITCYGDGCKFCDPNNESGNVVTSTHESRITELKEQLAKAEGRADPSKVMSAEDFSKRLLHMGYNQMPDTCDYIHAYAQNIITERDTSIRAQAIDECAELADKLCNPDGAYSALGKKIRALKTTGGSR